MIRTLLYAHRTLRYGLSIIFIWSGVYKFINPDFWIQNWIASWVLEYGATLGLTGIPIVYVVGIFEVLIAISLITSVFNRVFATIAFMAFVIGLITSGLLWNEPFSSQVLYTIALSTGCLTLMLWPDRGF